MTQDSGKTGDAEQVAREAADVASYVAIQQKRSNSAEQGAGTQEPENPDRVEKLLDGESLAAFSYRVGKPVDAVRGANPGLIDSNQDIVPGTERLVVPE